MRGFFFFQYFLFSFWISSSQTDSSFVKVAGFYHPESVVYDNKSNSLFVSNMGEKTAGDGFISRVSPEGKIMDTLWISGFDDPKGLLVLHGKLFVADNIRLVEMDIENKQITREYPIKEAGMLNDLAADRKGNIYISDTRKNSIFKMDTAGTISEWKSTEVLESPNGLLFTDNDLWIAAWGNDRNQGNFLKIDPETKEIQRVSDQGIGNLDGLQQNKAGDFYLSDWSSGKIYRIDAQSDIQEIITSARSVGDILLLEKDGLLILPMNLQNELWWYRLKK